MNSEDWNNIAKCANERVLAQTFSFDDEENNILGDLETREMAKSMAYRDSLLSAVYLEITQAIAETFDKSEILTELGDSSVRGISIELLTD